MSQGQQTENEIPTDEIPTDEGTTGTQKGTGSEVLNELQSLGLQLATAVQSLWDSDESRQLRQEIGEGFGELGRQLNSAVKSAQESEAAKEFSAQVKETVDKARDSDLADQVEQGLVEGLRELNRHLATAVDSMDASPKAESESESELQDKPEA
jgi:hypothetical protein